MKKAIAVTFVLALLLVAAVPGFAAQPGFGFLFYEGGTVRTVAPPAATPQEGIDPIYVFPEGGAEGQLSVTAVAPGDTNYHGGHWAVYVVTWNTAPYLLTSDDAVLAAAAAGDVTVTRTPENDILCPVQPGGGN